MAAASSRSAARKTPAVFMLALLAGQGQLLMAAPAAAADRRRLKLQGLGNRRILQTDQCSFASKRDRCIACVQDCLAAGPSPCTLDPISCDPPSCSRCLTA
ncbi:hypothetical protein SEVIR_2G212000v4 [Setaria viridis]|uniref:Bowman-Birk serine protease inhibitors family domain-containing protein n=1 Tax=Setaria viridis TaxID=4556 RepID=A0A4U6VTD4_SETVI|nr:hypothetical protein SEVIR_2G212000v2 [Setaria viridis]